MEQFPGKNRLEKATDFLKEQKKKTIIYGSLVATLGGLAVPEKTQAQQSSVDTSIFKKVDMRNEYRFTDQDSLVSDSAFRSKLEYFENNPHLILDESIDSLEKQRDWVLDKMDDPVYLMRATKYEGLLIQDINKRKEYLKNAKIVFVESDKIRSTEVGDAAGHTYGYRDNAIIAVATKSKNLKNKVPVVVHESAHARPTMSAYAYNLYQSAFFHVEDSIAASKNKTYGTPDWGFTETSMDTKEELIAYQKYFSQAEELDASRHVFEYEIEKLGIKKYGDEFTDETFDKVLRAIKEGKLSNNAVEFFTHINPEEHGKWIKLIMNTIA